MSARINLAPEVYQNSQRNKHRKRIATTAATTIGIVCAVLVAVLILIIGGQKGALFALQGDIDNKKKTIKEMSDLQAAVTLADHLKSWDKLNTDKTYLSEFFKVLQEFAPQGVSVSTLQISESNTLEVQAAAKSYALATKFAKALDAANVEIGSSASSTGTPYFSGTELSSVSEESIGVVSFKLTTRMSTEVTRGQN